MKIICAIFYLLVYHVCHAQHLPVSAYTYENCTDIDHYFGETDSLFKKYKIKSVKIWARTDTLQLMQTETYNNGKKMSSEEYGPAGKLERTIHYFYRRDTLEAELVHYPSVSNYNLFPARRFYYLTAEENNEIRYIFRRDRATGIVLIRIRHTWKKDGTILFEGFDMDNKMVATHIMNPVMSFKEYQNLSKTTSTGMIVNEMEEYTYNSRGKLIYFKSDVTNREDNYYYDDRGLLLRIERFLRGKPDKVLVYSYE